MSRERFDDECPGCRPAMVNTKTKQLYADDSPEMVIVNRLWGETTLEERQAWHRVTCRNSQAATDVRLASAFADRVQGAFAARGKN